MTSIYLLYPSSARTFRWSNIGSHLLSYLILSRMPIVIVITAQQGDHVHDHIKSIGGSIINIASILRVHIHD